MMGAYTLLHELGYAHSVETWQNGQLVGGVYGVALGKVFFGESMFSRRTNASKVAFVHLVKQLQAWGYQLLDCQVENPHLVSLGSTTIDRAKFKTILQAQIPPLPALLQLRSPKWALQWKYCGR